MIFWRLGLLLESEAALFPKTLFWNHWVPSKVGFYVWEAWWGSLDHGQAQELGLAWVPPLIVETGLLAGIIFLLEKVKERPRGLLPLVCSGQFGRRGTE